MKAKRVAAVFFGIAALAATAQVEAGSGNSLYIVQEQSGTAGNVVQINQTAGNYTSVGTSTTPALQRGQGNRAEATLSGNCTSQTACGTLALTQDNSTAGIPSGNIANVTMTGVGNASVLQFGDANTAKLAIQDGNGSINQTGTLNAATLEISGAASGSILQNGNSNTSNLQFGSLNGSTSVDLTQTGNGLSFGSAGLSAAFVLTTYPGAVRIEQTN